jgi:hypothetical protein
MPEDMVGKTVRYQGGEDAGTVRDFVTNDDGSIESLVLTRGGILGIGERNVAVPWNQVRVNPDNADMVLTLNEEQLEELPDFEYNQEARVVIGPDQPTK